MVLNSSKGALARRDAELAVGGTAELCALARECVADLLDINLNLCDPSH